jgi:hypothetical protein
VRAKPVELLRHDEDGHVRARAVELVGRFVHSHERPVVGLDRVDAEREFLAVVVEELDCGVLVLRS